VHAGALGDEAHEGLIGVGLAVEAPEFPGVDGAGGDDVSGAEDAADHLDGGDGDVETNVAECLDDLGGVAVSDGCVGAQRAGALGVVRIGAGLGTAFRGTGLDVADDAVDEAGSRQRHEREDHGCGVAPHAGDEPPARVAQAIA